MKALGTEQRLRLRLTIALVALALVYAFAVFWTMWNHKQRGSAGLYPDSVNPESPYYCLKDYRVTLTPESDQNAWLLQDYDEMTFQDRLLSDTACLDKLIIHGTSYIKRNPGRGRLVIRFFDPSSMKVRSRIVLKP